MSCKQLLCFGSLLVLLLVANVESKTLKDINLSRVNRDYSTNDVLSYLDDLQTIADNNNGNRAATTTGYNASAEYIISQLQANTDFLVTRDYFEIEAFSSGDTNLIRYLGGESFTYQKFTDYNEFTYSGNGTAIGPVVPISNFGCQAGDFPALNGKIALVKRGECDFGTKVSLASSAGANGALIYEDIPNTGAITGTLGTSQAIPAFSLSYDVAQSFISTPNAIVNMNSTSSTSVSYTYNVVAESQTGDASSIVVSGSHLDSVEAGPGINDNGSGSATNLEMAIEFSKLQAATPSPNKVRFLWFSGEELGLLGSTAYVDTLVASGDIANIALMLNFDMLGSPNYFRGVYDGAGADTDIRDACIVIESLFTDFFDFEGLYYDLTAFTGRSDYGPFIENGVPAGGLFTGAEVEKDVEYRKNYGGIALASFDTCYHKSCDTTYNIDPLVLDEMGKAAYFTLLELSYQSDLASYLNPSSSPANPASTKSPLPFKNQDNIHFMKQ